MVVLLRSLIIILLCASVSDAATYTAAASRTSGPAPLSVLFNAGFSTSSTTNRDFHNYKYVWDFDDSGAGTWQTGESKETDQGPVVGHVFESSGTYTVTLTIYSDATTVYDTDSFEITVSDPDTYYATTATTCVNQSSDSDFTGCPAGANQVQTDDMTTLTGYADAGERILFKRGNSWTSGIVSWPDNHGPVNIGAYGSCTSPSALGICTNDPAITLSASTTRWMNINENWDWRIQNLTFTGDGTVGGVFTGSVDYRQLLLMRIGISGTQTPLNLAGYKSDDNDNNEENFIVECYPSGESGWGIFAGSDYLAILGNISDNSTGSHSLRIHQAYFAVVAHNYISGAGSTDHALKFHAPHESEINGAPGEAGQYYDNGTEFVVVRDNVFGGSGPFTVSIGPENDSFEQFVTDVIFEQNRVIDDYGTQRTETRNSVELHGQYITARNNIIMVDDSTLGTFTGFVISRRGSAPAPSPIGVEAYNNTIYYDMTAADPAYGFSVDANSSDTIIQNNLISIPHATGTHSAISDASPDLASNNNTFTDTPGWVDPDNATPLSRDFSLESDSAAISAGAIVNVFDDFLGDDRPDGTYDVGAHEANEIPVRSEGSPASNIAYTATTTISLTTDVSATCKYDTSADTAYGSMSDTFGTTGTTSHSDTGVSVSVGGNTFYVRCTDGTHTNTTDYEITFNVLAQATANITMGGSSSITTGGSSTITLN